MFDHLFPEWRRISQLRRATDTKEATLPIVQEGETRQVDMNVVADDVAERVTEIIPALDDLPARIEATQTARDQSVSARDQAIAAKDEIVAERQAAEAARSGADDARVAAQAAQAAAVEALEDITFPAPMTYEVVDGVERFVLDLPDRRLVFVLDDPPVLLTLADLSLGRTEYLAGETRLDVLLGGITGQHDPLKPVQIEPRSFVGGETAVTLTETEEGAENSPHVTVVPVTVSSMGLSQTTFLAGTSAADLRAFITGVVEDDGYVITMSPDPLPEGDPVTVTVTLTDPENYRPELTLTIDVSVTDADPAPDWDAAIARMGTMATFAEWDAEYDRAIGESVLYQFTVAQGPWHNRGAIAFSNVMQVIDLQRWADRALKAAADAGDLDAGGSPFTYSGKYVERAKAQVENLLAFTDDKCFDPSSPSHVPGLTLLAAGTTGDDRDQRYTLAPPEVMYDPAISYENDDTPSIYGDDDGSGRRLEERVFDARREGVPALGWCNTDNDRRESATLTDCGTLYAIGSLCHHILRRSHLAADHDWALARLDECKPIIDQHDFAYKAHALYPSFEVAHFRNPFTSPNRRTGTSGADAPQAFTYGDSLGFNNDGFGAVFRAVYLAWRPDPGGWRKKIDDWIGHFRAHLTRASAGDLTDLVNLIWNYAAYRPSKINRDEDINHGLDYILRIFAALEELGEPVGDILDALVALASETGGFVNADGSVNFRLGQTEPAPIRDGKTTPDEFDRYTLADGSIAYRPKPFEAAQAPVALMHGPIRDSALPGVVETIVQTKYIDADPGRDHGGATSLTTFGTTYYDPLVNAGFIAGRDGTGVIELGADRVPVVTDPPPDWTPAEAIVAFDLTSGSGTTATDLSDNGFDGELLGGAGYGATGVTFADGTERRIEVPFADAMKSDSLHSFAVARANDTGEIVIAARDDRVPSNQRVFQWQLTGLTPSFLNLVGFERSDAAIPIEAGEFALIELIADFGTFDGTDIIVRQRINGGDVGGARIRQLNTTRQGRLILGRAEQNTDPATFGPTRALILSQFSMFARVLTDDEAALERQRMRDAMAAVGVTIPGDPA